LPVLLRIPLIWLLLLISPSVHLLVRGVDSSAASNCVDEFVCEYPLHHTTVKEDRAGPGLICSAEHPRRTVRALKIRLLKHTNVINVIDHIELRANKIMHTELPSLSPHARLLISYKRSVTDSRLVIYLLPQPGREPRSSSVHNAGDTETEIARTHSHMSPYIHHHIVKTHSCSTRNLSS
jgi:hypothetical protein